MNFVVKNWMEFALALVLAINGPWLFVVKVNSPRLYHVRCAVGPNVLADFWTTNKPIVRPWVTFSGAFYLQTMRTLTNL